MAITSFYAALFGLLFAALSVRTLRLRGRLRIGIGVGRIDEDFRFRVFGMTATLGVIIVASVYLLALHRSAIL